MTMTDMPIGSLTDHAFKAGHPPADLRAAYSRVDAYQPVYRFEPAFQDRPVSRTCRDRCEYLEDLLKPDIANIRLLDVGCSMGYLSLYFAERGAKVTGLDNNVANIEFCRTLAKAVGAPEVSFRRGAIDLEFCNALQEGEYDVVFIFSVLHHVIHKDGLDHARRMLSTLLDKVDTVFVELARRSEDVPFSWRESLPENELDVFADPGELEIEKLRDFPALGETTMRPLYRVRRRQRSINGVFHAPLEIRRSEIKTGQTRDRKYYLSGSIFTKCFVFDHGKLETYHRFLAEATAYRQIGVDPHFPRLIGTEIRGRLGMLTLARVEGTRLMEAIPRRTLDIRRVALATVRILRSFAAAGLYWNDFRAHNIVLASDGVFAMDLEVAAPIELENTLHLFLWLLYDIQSGEHHTQQQPTFQPGRIRELPLPPLALEQYAREVQDLAAAALASDTLHAFLDRTPQAEAMAV